MLILLPPYREGGGRVLINELSSMLRVLQRLCSNITTFPLSLPAYSDSVKSLPPVDGRLRHPLGNLPAVIIER